MSDLHVGEGEGVSEAWAIIACSLGLPLMLNLFVAIKNRLNLSGGLPNENDEELLKKANNKEQNLSLKEKFCQNLTFLKNNGNENNESPYKCDVYQTIFWYFMNLMSLYITRMIYPGNFNSNDGAAWIIAAGVAAGVSAFAAFYCSWKEPLCCIPMAWEWISIPIEWCLGCCFGKKSQRKARYGCRLACFLSFIWCCGTLISLAAF